MNIEDNQKIIEKSDKKKKILAFDPKNLSMPKYSAKYLNENNAAAVRHLLGGRRRDGAGAN